MSEYTEHVYQEYHGKTYEPLHQREEIVRCQDCKHSTGGGTCCWHFAYDELDGYNEWASQPADVEPDGFCKWAVRRLGVRP